MMHSLSSSSSSSVEEAKDQENKSIEELKVKILNRFGSFLNESSGKLVEMLGKDNAECKDDI